MLAIEVAQLGPRHAPFGSKAHRRDGASRRGEGSDASKPPIDEEGWLETLQQLKGEEAAANARKLLLWFKEQGFTTGVTDSQDAIFARLVRVDGKPTWPFFIRRSTGKIEMALQYLKENPAFASEEIRIKFA